jgi:hypothetical protein
VKDLDKDAVANALNAIQNGQAPGNFYDEIEVALGVLMETSEEVIAKVVEDIHEDCDCVCQEKSLAFGSRKVVHLHP